MQQWNHGRILKRNRLEPNEIIIKSNIAEIVLYNTLGDEIARTIIDAEDVDKVKGNKWSISKGYVSTDIDGKTKYIPYFIKKGQLIDHKDRDPLNNTKNNLRICTQTENNRNIGVRANSKSGYKGVYWEEKGKRWVARISENKTNHCLGRFQNKIDAAKAYNRAALIYFGEFAWLNPI